MYFLKIKAPHETPATQVNKDLQFLQKRLNFVKSTSSQEPLLFCPEKPLNPDLGSVLRDLALFCSHQRYRLATRCGKGLFFICSAIFSCGKIKFKEKCPDKFNLFLPKLDVKKFYL
jgi:hypothetical protein